MALALRCKCIGRTGKILKIVDLYNDYCACVCACVPHTTVKIWITMQLLTYKLLVSIAFWVCIYAGHLQLCSEHVLYQLSFSNDFITSAVLPK